VLPTKNFDPELYVLMATRLGTVKKTSLEEYSRPRTSGIIAVDLDEGDSLVGVSLTDGARDVMLVSSGGKAVRFLEEEVRPMGRNAHGVRGIRLGEGQEVIALLPIDPARDILLATENGYGKRTKVEEFPRHGRGGQGVIAIQTSERNGAVVGAVTVASDDEIMLISDAGTLVRTPVQEISVVGRNTQGVRLIALGNGEKLVSVEPVADVGGGDDAEDAPAT
jgi:DNA gyrase subunit A